MSDPDDVTLASYSAGVEAYAAACGPLPPVVLAQLDDLAALAPGGRVLEFGSATGRDAALLEDRGLRVQRSDGAVGFVEALRAAGHDVLHLDVRTDPFGGPWDVIYASAVFLHLSAAQLASVLARAGVSVRPGGYLAFSVKQGDGAGWSTAKLDRPRHFTYWQAADLRALLDASPWRTLRLDAARGRNDDWLYVLAVR